MEAASQPMPDESRTLYLGQELLIRMIDAGNHTTNNPHAFEALPAALSVKEVSDIGVQVSTLAERIVPSRDGYKHGAKSSQRTLYSLGIHAVASGDLATAESVARYFAEDRWSLNAQISGFVLRRLVKTAEHKRQAPHFWAPNDY